MRSPSSERDRAGAGITSAPAIELREITKAYGPVQANTDVSLVLQRGSVHAVLGENGAGKSTLMKILFGVEQPDSGEILIDGVVSTIGSPRDAIDAGIGMVFQHFGLVDELTALDNIALGAESGGPFRVDRAAARRRITELAAEVGLEIPIDRRVRDISVSQQQRVEILKALYRGARILILDEPTALLTPQERQGLFEAVGRLQQTGVAVLFITHKLDEADRLADDITVMRLGRVVARHRVGDVTHEQLITDMVGRSEVGLVRPERLAGPTTMHLDEVAAASDSVYPLRPTTLDVRAGEVLAVVGIDGHGHQTLCQVLSGVRPPSGGVLTVAGRRPRRWKRARAMALGISYVPEDRLAAGVAREESIADNLIANRLRVRRFVRAGVIRRAESRGYADELIERFDIRCRDRDQNAGSLSGGNVQKVVLAREIAVEPKVLVVCEPTRGLDIGAIQNVHTQISRAAGEGAAVVMQSSDLDEVVEVADRIVVFREGAIVGDLTNGPDVSIERLGALMLGRGEDADA